MNQLTRTVQGSSELATVSTSTYLLQANAMVKNEQGIYEFKSHTSSLDNANNIAPLASMPIIQRYEIDSDYHYNLWASDAGGKIVRVNWQSVLGEVEGNLNVILSPDESLLALPDGEYELAFPPLALLTQFVLSKDFEAKEEKLNSFFELTQKEGVLDFAPYTLHAIPQDKLRSPSTSGDDKLLVSEVMYKAWHDNNSGQQVRGFVCAQTPLLLVYFIGKEYAGGKYIISKLLPNGEIDASIATYEGVIVTEKENSIIRHFLADPLPSGKYLFTIELNDAAGQVPDYLDPSKLENLSEDRYLYEFIEDLDFSVQTPFGQMAVVVGDAFSLEESLITKFPRQLGHLMKNYQMGQDGVETSQSLPNYLAAGKAVAQSSLSLSNSYLNLDFDGNRKKQVFDIGRAIHNAIREGQFDQVLPPEVDKGLTAFFDILTHTKSISDWKETRNFLQVNNSLRSSQLASNIFHGGVSRFPTEEWRVANTRIDPRWFPALRVADTVVKGATLAITIDGMIKDVGGYIKAQDNKEQALIRLEDTALDYIKNCIQPVEDESLANLEGQVEQSIYRVKGNALGLEISFHYEANKFEIESRYNRQVSAICNFLAEHKEAKAVINGYASVYGSSAENLRLSSHRVDEVITHLNPANDPKVSERLELDYSGYFDSPLHNANTYEEHRKVTVTVYTEGTRFKIYQSRTLQLILENSRKHHFLAKTNASEVDKKLMASVSNSVLSTAGFIPGVAPYAWGLILMKTGLNAAMSTVDFLDEVIFDSMWAQHKYDVKQKQDISDIYEYEYSMMHQYQKVVSDEYNEEWMEKPYTSIELARAAITEGDRPVLASYLLKLYYTKGIALSGLMILLHFLETEKENSDLKTLIENQDDVVEGYITKYLRSDEWVKSYDHFSLATSWIDEWLASHRDRKNAKSWSVKNYWEKFKENAHAEQIVYHPFTDTSLYFNRKQAGAFDSMFPTLTEFTRGTRRSLVSEVQAGTRKISSDDIDKFIVEFRESGDLKWMPYYGQTLTPFDEVRVRIVAKKGYSGSHSSSHLKLCYQRTDIWLGKVQGPTFNVTMLHQPCESVGINDEGTRLVAEFMPFYRFSGEHFFGLKPLLGPWWDMLSGILDMFDSMEYEFLLKGENDVAKIPLGDGNPVTVSVSDSDQLRYVKGRSIRESDLLVPSFYTHSSVDSSNPNIFNKGSSFSLFAKYKGQYYPLQTSSSLKVESWNDEIEFIVMAVADRSHVEKTIVPQAEKLGWNWKHNIVQFDMSGEVQDGFSLSEIFSNSSNPSLLVRTQLDYVGELDVSFDTKASSVQLEQNASEEQKSFVEYLKHDIPYSAREAFSIPRHTNGIGVSTTPRKALFIGHYKPKYESPTGKIVKGIRPLGKVKDLTKPYQLDYSFNKLQVTGINSGFSFAGDPKLSMSEFSEWFKSTSAPWLKRPTDSTLNNVTYYHWERLNTDDKKRERVLDWISNSRNWRYKV